MIFYIFFVEVGFIWLAALAALPALAALVALAVLAALAALSALATLAFLLLLLRGKAVHSPWHGGGWPEGQFDILHISSMCLKRRWGVSIKVVLVSMILGGLDFIGTPPLHHFGSFSPGPFFLVFLTFCDLL